MSKPTETVSGAAAACPDADALAAFGDGRDLPEQQAALEEHLDSCAACRRLVAAMARDAVASSPRSSAASPDHQIGPADIVLARGDVVGRYTVLERRGAGAMGVVYAAYDSELDRKIALKILRTGPDGAAGEARQERLVREARAMAKVSHPNTVAVHDVGTLEDRVFVAMEFVAGQTVREWLAAGERTWRETVDLFVQAGRGLAAAHDAGLVHRDIKPDNILVGDDTRVRVSDFGLAGFMEAASEAGQTPEENGEPAPSHSLTRTGAVLGSPAYMAPEQHRGERATPRSDQFSFCVALYEALYGERPFDASDVNDLAAAVTAGQMRSPPRGSQAPGWVRDVVSRGLSSEPGDRHPSMRELLLELASDPRAKRRRQWAIAVSAAVLLAAVTGTYLISRAPSTLCTGAEKNLQGVWDAGARDAVEKAFLASGRPHAADTFLRVEKRLDAWTGEWVAQHAEACEATRITGSQSEDVLDLRMRCLARKLRSLRSLVEVFAEEPDAKVVDKAVEASAGLGSIAFCGDVEALELEIAPPEDATTREAVEAVRGRLEEARQRAALGKYREADALLDDIVAEAEAIDYPPLQTELAVFKGESHERLGRYEEAEATLEEALRSALTWRQWELASRAAQGLTSAVGGKMRRHAEGLAYGQVALGLAGGLDDEQQAIATDRVGGVLWVQGRYQEAEKKLRQAVGFATKAFGPDHPRVASVIGNLALAVETQGRDEEAETLYRRAITIKERSLGPEHPSVANTVNNLGSSYLSQEKYHEAESQYRRALTIRAKVLGPKHPEVAAGMLNLGGALGDLGRHEEAERMIRRALVSLEQAFGPDHPHVASGLCRLGKLLQGVERYDDAAAALQQCFAVREKALGPAHPMVAYTRNLLGGLFYAQGRYQDAQKQYRPALASFLDSFGEDHPDVAVSLVGLGNVCWATKRHPDAKENYERALAVCSKQSCQPRVEAQADLGMARILWKEERQKPRAIQLAKDARQLSAKKNVEKELAEAEAWLTARGVKLEPLGDTGTER